MAEDYFIIEHEGHIPNSNEAKEYRHYRDWHRFQNSVEGVMRMMTADGDMAKALMAEHFGPEAEKQEFPQEPEHSISRMDEAGIDMCCLVPHRQAVYMNVDPRGPSMSWTLDACAKYPDRLIPAPVWEPSTRGVENAIWELEYCAKEHGVKYGKIYPPGELWLLNDKRYWPFYAKAEELGVMLGMHMGHGYIYGANTHACRPGALEDVCREFYDLKILAFHFGWPWHHELNSLAACYPGLHIGMSFLNATVWTRPRFFGKLLGEAIMYAGVDKVLWSNDSIAQKIVVDGFRHYQFPEDLQQGYGFKPLTEEHKAKIFGLNMARLLGIEPIKKTK